MKVLVLKLTKKEHISGVEDYRSGWKLSPIRLRDVDFGIVLDGDTVVEQFSLGQEVSYNLKTGRVILTQEKYSGNHNLIGNKYDYRTSNPATIKELEDLEKIEK